MAEAKRKILISTLASTAFAGGLYFMLNRDVDGARVENMPEADVPVKEVVAPSFEVDLSEVLPKERKIVSVFFDAGSHDLRETEQSHVKELSKYLQKTGETFEIRGCASAGGKELDNFALSYRRAGTVFNVFQDDGLNVSRHGSAPRQNGDVYGMGVDCPSLHQPLDQVRTKTASMQRVDVIINPDGVDL